MEKCNDLPEVLQGQGHLSVPRMEDFPLPSSSPWFGTILQFVQRKGEGKVCILNMTDEKQNGVIYLYNQS